MSTLMLFQTCMKFALLLNTKDILKNVGKQTVDVPINFHSVLLQYYGSEWQWLLAKVAHLKSLSSSK